MNPKKFLQLAGLILVLVGILGFVGVLGPTPDKSIFGPGWWFDNSENWAHLVLGIVGLIAAYAFGAGFQKTLVTLLGAVGVLIGLYSLFISTMFFGANLENPADTLLHLVVGAWALWAARGKSGSMGMSM